jgi:hypothetical protein
MTARLVTHQHRGDNIQIEIETINDLPCVLGDEGQLQQAIVALATNAIDAMPEGGTLTATRSAIGAECDRRNQRHRLRHPSRETSPRFSIRFLQRRTLAAEPDSGWLSVMVLYLSTVAVLM